MRNELRFGLLGPPVLYDAHGEVGSIGSRKTRALLAALLLEPGRVVSVEVLKDALWGGAPPASAHASLQNHVTRLRRLLDDPERLRAVPPGYVLRVGEGELDVRVFERHAALARDAHAERDWERALRESAAALALWRGAPLGGLPPETGGHALVQRLEEARLLVLEWGYEAELGLDPTASRLDRLAPELAARTAEYPLRESFHRLLMLVLHRAGRQAEALAVHRDLRARLLDELGVEPGPAVRRAHLEILREDDGTPGEFRTEETASGGGAPGNGDAGWIPGEAPDRRRGGDRRRQARDRSNDVDGTRAWGRGDAWNDGREDANAGGDGSARRDEGVGGGDGIGRGGNGDDGDRRRHGRVDRDGAAARDITVDRAGKGGRDGSSSRDGNLGDDGAAGRDSGMGRGGGAGRHGNSVRDGSVGQNGAAGRNSDGGQAGRSGRDGAFDRDENADLDADADLDAYAGRDADRGRDGDARHDADRGRSRDARQDADRGRDRDARQDDDRGRGGDAGRDGGGGPVQADGGAVEPEVGSARAERDTASPPRPAQLPPPPAHFTGREDVRDRLLRILNPEHSLRLTHRQDLTPAAHPDGASDNRPSADAPAGAPARPATGMPRVAVISGMAGVGKSALALHVAHGLRERFTDGQLYVNLHGATPGMTPLTAGQALAALLRDLGAEPRRIPEHPDAAAALLRSMLAPTRTLMVLDDAAHAAQVRPLLPAGPGCAVIVTSRSPLAALDGADRFPLAPLTDEDSAALLRAVSGRREGLDGGHPLVELTGRLPLALRVVAARLAARRALTPDVLAGQLAATEGRLHHLEYDDLSVRRSLAVAHDALRASEREADQDAALALCRIGALDLPAYGAALVARLTGTDERRAEAALDRLVDVALLEETAYGRYAPHDLVRDFAREIAGAAECVLGTGVMGASAGVPAAGAVPGAVPEAVPGAGGAAALAGDDGRIPVAVAERALRWYAGVAARSLEALLEPGLDRDDRSRPTASQPAGHAADVAATPPFCSAREAFAWGDTELANVVALAERYAHTSPYFPLLARLLNPYVQRSGRVAELEVLQRAALAAARLLGDEAAEAYALGDLGGLHFMTGRVGEALTLNDDALAIWRRLGVRSCQRRALNNRGMLLESLGRHAESGEALLQSLQFSRELGDPHMEAITYSHLGNLYEHTDPRAAIDHHKRSLAIGDAVQDVIIRHSAHCNIGYAHLTLGEPAAAVPHFEESLRILGGHGDWHGESQTRLGLVRALRGVGQWERAVRECDLLRCRADRRADGYTGGLARHQAGLLLRERGDIEAARREWASALEALEDTDSPVTGELRELLAR
ncbi:BTAD domain-containing putative transcriptional regulator [Streptomyces sp. NPDC051997]|uniref:BTAD domain-containing putative transcriptional regulator n=1 Tax=Streptomyces sp. NPDC051997 TaxID=3155611 RepID=UPI0034230F98